MKNSILCQNIDSLMQKQQIRASDLARRTGLPQPTVYRIVKGITSNPHQSSLESLAEYFGMSVKQLCDEPLVDAQTPEKFAVPHLDWQQASFWPNYQKTQSTIITDARTKGNAFALTISDSEMAPLFPLDTIIIIDDGRKLKDRSYALFHLHTEKRAVLRQVFSCGHAFFLKPLSPELQDLEMVKVTDKDTYIGGVTQAIHCYEE